MMDDLDAKRRKPGRPKKPAALRVAVASTATKKERPKTTKELAHDIIYDLNSRYPFPINFDMLKARMDEIEAQKNFDDAAEKLKAAHEAFQKAVEQRGRDHAKYK